MTYYYKVFCENTIYHTIQYQPEYEYFFHTSWYECWFWSFVFFGIGAYFLHGVTHSDWNFTFFQQSEMFPLTSALIFEVGEEDQLLGENK